MAKVLRCPACGALWRVKDDFAEPTVRCSECQAIFSADKMENVIVPDEKLDERLNQQAAAQNPSQTSAESGEATMTALAGSLAEFDARATLKHRRTKQRLSPRPLTPSYGLWAHWSYWWVRGLQAYSTDIKQS